MFIVRPTTERRFANLAKGSSFNGIGRNVTTLRREGHTNPSANTYDNVANSLNSDLAVGIHGNLYVEHLAQGWYSIAANGNTYRVHADTRVMFSTNGYTAMSLPVSEFFNLCGPTREGYWTK